MCLVALLLLPLVLSGGDRIVSCGDRIVSSGGERIAIPPGWTRVTPADDGNVVDPRTLLVVGTAGVRPRASRCQIASYRVPPRGGVVVVVGWETAEPGGGTKASRAPLRKLRRVTRPSFECFVGRGAVAQVVLGGRSYQVNVMVGDHASQRRIDEALAIGRSFDLAR